MLKLSKRIKQNRMECIICCDDTVPLCSNNHCPCFFVYHESCWEEYRRQTTPLKCPMCRNVLKPQQTHDSGETHEISYEEFVDIVRTSTPTQPHRPERKTAKTVVGVLLLAGMVAFLIVGFKTFF